MTCVLALHWLGIIGSLLPSTTGLVLGQYWVSTEHSAGGCEGVSGLGCASLVGLLAQSARAGPSEYLS